MDQNIIELSGNEILMIDGGRNYGQIIGGVVVIAASTIGGAAGVYFAPDPWSKIAVAGTATAGIGTGISMIQNNW